MKRAATMMLAVILLAAPAASAEHFECPALRTCFEVVGEVVERQTVWLGPERGHVERLRLANVEPVLYCPAIGPPGTVGGTCGRVEVGERYRAVGAVVLQDDGSETYRVGFIAPAAPAAP